MMKKLERYLPFIICLVFFLAYATLSVVRHLHFGSGFDLAISDQIIWKYSQLQAPITTVQFYPFTSIFTDHIEFIYILLVPFYWLYNSAVTLLILQAFFVVSSGIPIYLLAKKRGLKSFLSLAILVSYLMFYGIQNAIWADVHSLAFGAGFLAWFIYFLDVKNIRWAIVSFVLAVFCKEDMALLTGIVSFVYLITRKDKVSLLFLLASGMYLFAAFFLYFPYFTQDGYRYQNEGGLFSDLNLAHLYDSVDKRNTIFYSLAWFGFLPLVAAPVYLLPAFGDIAHYFIFAHSLEAAHGFYLHYRVALGVLLVWPTIMALYRFKWLNNRYVAVYIVLLAVFFQYYFHLPLSYLAKQWFWTEPDSVRNIKEVVVSLPDDISVVSQNNITPHVSHRDSVFTLFPTTKDFLENSPCGATSCNWFRWAGEPEHLLIDTSTDWDARHFLTNRETFVDGIRNLEKAQVITKHKQAGNAVIYKILKKP